MVPAEPSPAFEVCAKRLHALSFPVLGQPPKTNDGPRKDELVPWAIDVYVFLFLAHLRQLLDSFNLLHEKAHCPTTFFVARAVMEVAGQGCYVLKKLRVALRARDFDTAWGLLHAATMGRDSRGRTAAREALRDLPQTIHVMDGIRALGEFLPGTSRAIRREEALELYEHLCDFCHPNIGAFTQYAEFEERGDRGYMRLLWSPKEPPPLNETAIAVAAGLVAASDLLEIYDQHTELRVRVSAAAEELVGLGNRERDR